MLCGSLIQKMELMGKVRVYGPLTGSSQKSKNQFWLLTMVLKHETTGQQTYL